MFDNSKENSKKVIAFYLPQYHAIPENNKWWGENFTEWVNTRKARPLFPGHYQPKVPLHENYYDLSHVEVMEKQAELAKKYGVYGFCYYHYWFKDGKKLLEKPVENMLHDRKVDIPFCLSWANENWSRNWDGGNREIIMEQDYGDKIDWEKHFIYLLDFFKDDRYIKVDNKPLLLIYKPEQIDKFNDMVKYFKNRAIQEGFNDLLILRQNPSSFIDKYFDDSYIDYTVKFEPATYWALQSIKESSFVKEMCKSILHKLNLDNIRIKLRRYRDSHAKPQLRKYNYDEAWNYILNSEPYNEKIINGAFVDWDNTARNKNGALFVGATPDKFYDYMSELVKKESALNMIFINAWNEWAEGAYLEPDEKYSYGYLEALKKSLLNNID